jgi:predicted Zn-dependent protease
MAVPVLDSCGGLNLFTINDDAKLGQQIDAEIRNNPGQYPILNNEPIRGYLQGIVDKITAAPTVKYRGTFPYRVTVINDPATINAFATPGGYIYVYTGLLKFVDNEATLAGILGHEIAHAEERHGTEHMTTQLGLETILGIALGNNPSGLAQSVGNAAGFLAMMKNSRDDETQADTRSFEYLRSTPYWPGAITLFFEKMASGATTGGASTLEQWSSTHPMPQDRVDNVKKLIRDNNIPAPTESSLMRENFRRQMRQLK